MVTFNGTYTVQDHGGYTEYIVSSNSHFEVIVEDNDVFENVHINQEASGASCRIRTYHSAGNLSDNWTIRNLAVTGQRDNDQYLLTPATNTTGRIEHCYFGDGDYYYPGSPHGTKGFCWSPREHNGHLEIHGVYIEGWTDNGWYCSPSGEMTGSGSYHFTNCYARNCHISLYRLGGATSPGQDTVENCYGYTGSNDHRGVWAYDNAERVEIIDSDLEASGSSAILVQSGATAYIENTSYSNISDQGSVIDGGGNDNYPQERVPSGCPDTAEKAYTGKAAGDEPQDGDTSGTLDPVDPSPYDNTIVFRNEDGGTTSSGETPTFYHQVEGEIEETSDYDTSVSETVWQEDTNEWHATGDVGWREAFRYNSPTLGLEAEDPIQVEINGTSVNPDNYGTPQKTEPPQDSDPELPRIGQENFDHQNISGVYRGDTDNFTVADNPSVTSHGNDLALMGQGTESNYSLILNDDYYVEDGRTYEVDLYRGEDQQPNFGIALAAQSVSTWSNYTGYLIYFGDTDTRIDRWENGKMQANVSDRGIPQKMTLTAEIDFRESSNQIELTITDQGPNEYVNITLDDQTFSKGYYGFYNWDPTVNVAIYNLEIKGFSGGSGDSPHAESDDSGGNVPVDGELDPDDRQIGSVWFREDLP